MAESLVGIVGCGRMGSALARRLAIGPGPPPGMLLTSRTLSSARNLAAQLPVTEAGPLEWLAASADIVFLVTPIAATCSEIAPRIRGLVAGKPVVDVSNPDVSPAAGQVERTVSAAEQIAGTLPGSHVVKALNCVSWHWLAEDPPVAAGAGAIPVAGDSAWAKRQVSSILRRAGLAVADAGPLSSSRWIERWARQLMRLERPDDASAEAFGLPRLPSLPGAKA